MSPLPLEAVKEGGDPLAMHRYPGHALVIVGHGSTTNPDSSEPTRHIADSIRGGGLFDEVHCCFWKEEPSMREILHTVISKNVYVVPNFISEGYFTRTVIPRELELEGPVTVRNGRTFRYCDPSGSHPSMTSILLERARVTAPGVDPAATSLLIVGHGTKLDENSAKAAVHQATLLSGLGIYAGVLPAFMEEAPFVSDWAAMTSSPNVVVIPFFISDGLHSYQDIPVLLGIRSMPGPAASRDEVFQHNPHRLHGRTLHYGSAIGTDPGMERVILDQVEAFASNYPSA